MQENGNTTYNPSRDISPQMPSIEAVDPLKTSLDASRVNQQGMLPKSVPNRLLTNSSGTPVKILVDGIYKHTITTAEATSGNFTFTLPHGLGYIPQIVGQIAFTPISSASSVYPMPSFLGGVIITVDVTTNQLVTIRVLLQNSGSPGGLLANIGVTLYFRLFCFNYQV
jgi:hypothetical protein